MVIAPCRQVKFATYIPLMHACKELIAKETLEGEELKALFEAPVPPETAMA